MAILTTIVVETLRKPFVRIEIAPSRDNQYEGRPARQARFLYLSVQNDPLPRFARWMARNAVQAFHAAGYDVTAIDFSPAAVDQAKRVLGGLAERVILGDFFTYDFGQCRFDLIYERTFIVGNEQIDAPVPDLSPPRIHQINKHEHNENEYPVQKTKYQFHPSFILEQLENLLHLSLIPPDNFLA